MTHTRFRLDAHGAPLPLLPVQTASLSLIALIFIGWPTPELWLMHCAIHIVLLVNDRLVLLYIIRAAVLDGVLHKAILLLFFTECGVSFVQSWPGCHGSRCDFMPR